MNAKAKQRYKEIEFPFKCPISDREFGSGRALSVYLTKTLKVEHSEYYDKYINHRDSSCFSVTKKGLLYQQPGDIETCVMVKNIKRNPLARIILRALNKCLDFIGI